MADPAKRTNRLGEERSTYLRSAAHQSIDWFPWSKEPFAVAGKEGKPVLLDIGASWCHWCHVMDEGTYENAGISDYINEHYIAVKVDRDERPDVDARYQRAVNAMTGQGGWPLTVFLDDTGRPFYGGTYFPPVQTGEMPGFLDLLKRISDYYSSRKEEREEVARSVMESVTAHERYDEEDVGDAEVRAALQKTVEQADAVNGGFGYSPKFPHTSAVELLMSLAYRGRREAEGPVKLTLDGMMKGGIHDQLGGGFHRYSTDEKWIVPHFEKMAYDNAGLLKNYIHAYQIFHEEEYRRTAKGIVAFVSGTLSGEDCFYSSQDADAKQGDDGDYWTWSPDELADALDGEERKVASLYYHIHGMPEMHRKDRHVLYRAVSAGEIAEKMSMTEAEVASLLDTARTGMLEARGKRPTPTVDRSVFGSMNGMLASSFFEYSLCFEDCSAYEKARRSVENYIEKGFSSGKGFAHSLSGGGIWGLLEDQVNMIHASLDLFEMGSSARAGEVARQARAVLEGYASPAGGLYDVDPTVYSGEEIGLVNSRGTPIYDTPSQSPVSSAALLLLRTAAVFEDDASAKSAGRIIRAIAPSCISSGAFAASIFTALDRMVNDIPLVVIAGSSSNRMFNELKKAAAAIYMPGKETVLIDTDVADAGIYSATMQSIITKTREQGKPLAFTCRGRSCSPPAETPERLLGLLAK